MLTKETFINQIYNTLSFRPFTKSDWVSYSGCNTKWYPLISNFKFNDKDYDVIFENNTISVYNISENEDFDIEWFVIDLNLFNEPI